MSADSLLTYIRQSKTCETSETGVAASNYAHSPVSPPCFSCETGDTNLRLKENLSENETILKEKTEKPFGTMN